VSEYKIEDGIPMPPAKNLVGVTATLRKLTPGQSVLFPGRTPTNLGPFYRRLAPARFAARTVTGGVRVWRLS
jgi:hypothetical protein